MQPLVIFDCDGVLVDSERISHTVLNEMLAELGVTLSFEETVRQFIGASIPISMARVAELAGGQLPADFFAQFARRTKAAFEAGLLPMPGIEAVLDSMACPYCVASNGNHAKVNFTLTLTGLMPRFKGRIFTADDVLHPKPAPDLFLHAAKMMGAAPEKTTVVEDTPTGIMAAKGAGMKAIGFAAMTPVQRLLAAGADMTATTMNEIRRLLVEGANA